MRKECVGRFFDMTGIKTSLVARAYLLPSVPDSDYITKKRPNETNTITASGRDTLIACRAALRLVEGWIMQTSTRLVGTIVWLVVTSSTVWPADPVTLKPRVPSDQLASARQMTNRYSMMEGIIEEGKQIFEEKGFCRTCHGLDGKGLGSDIELESFRGPLPRNFTDKEWQAARTDGELFWILKHGSKGTAMTSFIPLVLTEEEAWKVISYVRSFAQP